MCFGGSDSSGKMIKMQEQEADESRAKETARQARLSEGLARIRAAFEGAPVMGRRQVATPGGTQTVMGQPTTSRRLVTNDRTGRQSWVTTTNPGKARTVATPAGTREEEYDTGQRSGGFDDNFFNQFRDAMTSYYMPQVQEQYGEAKDKTTYGLARAGTLRSSAAIDEQAKLAKQNTLREGEVRTKADEAVGGLRDRLATERSKAESQLYATEDPNVAANQALAAVENISAEKPTLTPLGALFDIASIGGAGAVSGYQNAEYLKKYGLGRGGDASRTIT